MLGAKDPKAENVSLAFAHQEYLHNFEEILRVSCVAEHIDEWHDANDARKRVGRSAAGAKIAGARASAGAEMDVETREESGSPLDALALLATQQLRRPEEHREEHVSEVEEPQVHDLTEAALEQHDAAGGAGSGVSASEKSISLLLSEDVDYEVDSNGDDWTVEKIMAHKLFTAFEVSLGQDFADYEAGVCH